MKTHQEIHDAIQTTQVEATASTLTRILDILDALNDRIEQLYEISKLLSLAEHVERKAR